MAPRSVLAWLRRPGARWGVALGVFGALERLALWWVYRPVSYGDTPSYLRLARPLANLTLKGYDGTRVPGYPAFLALTGQDPMTGWLAQMAIGWLVSLALFWVTWRTTDSPATGALVGFLYDVIPGQVLFEANLLSETLTTALIVFNLVLLVALERVSSGVGVPERVSRGARDLRTSVVALGLGVAASLVGLVRPLFYLLSVWLAPFVWLAGRGTWRDRALRLAIYSLGPVVLLGGWVWVIFTRYHMVSPTTMGGYNLVQHTGEYFEYLPDEYATIRDTYLKYRDARIAERGVQTNAIWEAIPEMTKATGMHFFELSRELQRLSIRLIREHPDLYLENVAEGWLAFWKAPVYWDPEAFRLAAIRPLAGGLALLGRGISLAANATFLLLCALAVLSRRGRVSMGVDRLAMAVAGLIWLTSVVQTLVDHGDNPRFLVPLQMLVIYTVVRTLWFTIRSLKSREDVG